VCAGALSVLAAGCDTNELLTVPPATILDEEIAISDPASARAAVAGMYDALSNDFYYGEQIFTVGDLSADNTDRTGTFTSYSDIDRNALNSQNSAIKGMWDVIYRSINRANVVIERMPGLAFLTQAEKDQMVAEALFVRALGYHNLVKYWGGVPIRTEPTKAPGDVASLSRATPAEVYAQILADLQQAQTLIKTQRSGLQISLGAIRALRARVYLYQQNWSGAETEANAVLAMGYALAPTYGALFTPEGTATSEDILRIAFTATESSSLSYYYLHKNVGGRREMGPTTSIRNAYEAGDDRRAYSISNIGTQFYVKKYPSVVGTEHLHVIRLGEILLIKAEAQARLGRLGDAITTVNALRTRAKLPALVLGSTNLTTQAEVLAAIDRERRIEMAFEGDRWPDLVRRGTVVQVMNLAGKEHQALYPIPQADRDVSQGLEQNPGY
jgi:hypothetical protein